MLVFSMIAEAFAVIGHEDDERAVVKVLSLQEIQEAPDDRVGGRNLSVVRVLGVECAKRLGRLIRRMRLVEVKKAEQAAAGRLLLDPVLENLLCPVSGA